MQVDTNHGGRSKLSCSESLTYSEQPDSRFMIDYQTYFKFHPSAAAYDFDRAEKYPFDTRPMYLDSNADCNADLYCLMAPDTYGFYFTEKKWSQYP